MQKNSAAEFKKLLTKSSNIVIVTHWSPDGDAMGSSLALQLFLSKMGKKARVIVPNDYPEFLSWMPGNNKVLNFSANEKKATKEVLAADLIFTLDFNSYKRLEKLGEVLQTTTCPKVLIDHHRQPDDYASYYFYDVEACSTCELVFDFMVLLGKKNLLDKKIAACLYTGFMTDTGLFRYPSVNSRTHLIISELLKTGISHSDIYAAVYDNYSYNRIKLLGYALSQKLKIIEGYPVAYFALTEKELEAFSYEKGDLEGIVNYPFSIKGIKVCALFNETSEYVKISFRSKGKIDVNKFARAGFNGGGHMNAAGGKSMESLAATEQKFISSVKQLF
ncbi:MAG: bifunctional oligoribonuclease/PAP phosphatase NrnA [Bacteroidia bacterium]|nr:bifunctional oligoribonuclease/PAP phosphatase NrnA [Bacteroidia bacterium]